MFRFRAWWHWFPLALFCLYAWSRPVFAETARLPDFTVLAQDNSPAVVNIGTTVKKADRAGDAPSVQIPDLPEDSPLNEFFRRFFGDGIEGPDLEPRSSLGSGFILSEDGYVISNHHVVKDADTIIVRLIDRREFVAKLVGSDERSDLAVLKIDAQGLPAVRLGKSADLKVGEWVLAIGSPFGFDYSVTAGIVSAKGRALPNESYVPFIQTDVAINPGNSGGPLFNLDGKVVGVNSQIYSRTGGFMGLSFAIPVEVVMNVYQQIRDSGKVSRGWLGVLIQEVTRELAESFGMDRPHGALIAKVLPDGPAVGGGLKAGDVIVEFNGVAIERSSDLPPVVGGTAVGTKVPAKVVRDGKRIELSIKIGELPPQEALKLAAGGKSNAKVDARLKIAVRDLNRKEREDLDGLDHGVMVESVQAGPARSAGVRKGDIILMLNNEKVKDVDAFKLLVDALPAGKSVPLLVQRQDGPLFFALKVP
ncbi:MAG: DegQ family serine endoprotease [Gammaproteobacteria bacterium]